MLPLSLCANSACSRKIIIVVARGCNGNHRDNLGVIRIIIGIIIVAIVNVMIRIIVAIKVVALIIVVVVVIAMVL